MARRASNRPPWPQAMPALPAGPSRPGLSGLHWALWRSQGALRGAAGERVDVVKKGRALGQGHHFPGVVLHSAPPTPTSANSAAIGRTNAL